MWLKPAIFFIHKPSAKADGNIISIPANRQLKQMEVLFPLALANG
jgi:hypothetical protein